MPVHLFGQCADMEAISRIAGKHGLPVIEDAAQAFGSECHGKKAGGGSGPWPASAITPRRPWALSATAAWSSPTTAIGPRTWPACACPAWSRSTNHKQLGWNARLDAIHAAILRVKLPHVESWIAARQAVAQRYDGLIATHRLTDFLTPPVVQNEPAAHVQSIRGPRGRRLPRRAAAAPERAGGSAAKCTIPGRYTCRNVSLISVIAKAIFPSAKQPAIVSWPCRCTRNDRHAAGPCDWNLCGIRAPARTNGGRGPNETISRLQLRRYSAKPQAAYLVLKRVLRRCRTPTRPSTLKADQAADDGCRFRGGPKSVRRNVRRRRGLVAAIAGRFGPGEDRGDRWFRVDRRDAGRSRDGGEEAEPGHRKAGAAIAGRPKSRRRPESEIGISVWAFRTFS